MSLVSSVRSSLSGIAAKFADGVVEYRTLTSAPNAQPRTYSAWVRLPVSRCTDCGETQFQDPDSGIWYREETCQLRIPSQEDVHLTVRDQIRQGPTSTGVAVANIVWSVKSQTQSAAGAVNSYFMYRRTPMLGDPRQGGV